MLRLTSPLLLYSQRIPTSSVLGVGTMTHVEARDPLCATELPTVQDKYQTLQCSERAPKSSNHLPLWRFPRAGLLPSPVRFAHFARAGDSAVKLWEGEMLVPGR
jgi:hypothetical protein